MSNYHRVTVGPSRIQIKTHTPNVVTPQMWPVENEFPIFSPSPSLRGQNVHHLADLPDTQIFGFISNFTGPAKKNILIEKY